MTTKTILLSAGLLLSTGIFAQQNSNAVSAIPAAVTQALNMSFPTATTPTWEMVQGFYVPVFKVGNQDMKALIDPKGRVVQSQAKLDVTALPAAAKSYLQNNFAGQAPTEAATVSASNGKTRLTVMIANKLLVFDDHGAFLQETHTPLVY